MVDPRAGDVEVFDLAVEYFPGMPYIPATAPFHYGLTREHGDHFLADGLSSSADQIVMNLHSGTLIDAFCHYARHGKLFGDLDANPEQAKWRGYCNHGIHTVAPIVRSGVLLDVAASEGMKRLPRNTPIDAAMLERAQARSGTVVQGGDVVLVRTGDIQDWPAEKFYDPSSGVPGLDLDGARWLSDRRVFLVGSDNFAIEHLPATSSGRRAAAMPVHGHLLVDKGIYLLEVMNLEELSAAGCHRFTFVALPLKIRGATGSPVRPIAIRESVVGRG